MTSPHRVRQAEGGREVNIEDEIAAKIHEFDCGCPDGAGDYSRWKARQITPLVKRAQAEALRDAAADNEHGWALRTWLNSRADRIEQNSEGNET